MFNLTKEQDKIFMELMSSAMRKTILLKDASPRNVGKTTILNEIGFECQALGYDVFIMRPYLSLEYIATGYIDISNEKKLSGYKTNLTNRRKQIVMMDEVKFYHESTIDIIKRCKELNIPIVGFVNYN